MSIHGGFSSSTSKMLFGLKRLQPQIKGQSGCDVPFRVFLCYLL
jgi:hypothetical protein